MVTNMADKIGLKQRKCHFLTKFKAFGDRFLRIRYQHCLIQKNVMRHVIKISLWYLLVLYVNFYVKPLSFVPNWSISFFQPILAANFDTIATVKVKVIRDFYALVIVLINL